MYSTIVRKLNLNGFKFSHDAPKFLRANTVLSGTSGLVLDLLALLCVYAVSRVSSCLSASSSTNSSACPLKPSDPRQHTSCLFSVLLLLAKHFSYFYKI